MIASQQKMHSITKGKWLHELFGLVFVSANGRAKLAQQPKAMLLLFLSLLLFWYNISEGF